MKKFTLFLFGLFVFSPAAFASVESMQIVTFQWDAKARKLKPVATGSGTAIQKNLVLTNKHVVAVGESGVADFVLLCPAQTRSTRSVSCDMPAVVISMHEKYDAALIKPISEKVFLPHVKLAREIPKLGDRIRVEGFPVAAISGVQNFGGTATANKIKKWSQHGGSLEIGGDKLTITRGKITGSGKLKSTGGKYFLTNVKVNFGNSGGAAFDKNAEFIGIPTLRDKEFNALVLQYNQLKDWLDANEEAKPKVDSFVLAFYEKNAAKKEVSKTKTKRGRIYLTRSSKSKRYSATKSRRSYYPRKRNSTRRSISPRKTFTTRRVTKSRTSRYNPRKRVATAKKTSKSNVRRSYRTRGSSYYFRRR